MLEAYVESIGKLYMQVPRTRTSAKTELGKIMDSFRESVQYVRNIVNETGLNVTQGKRVQRQVRYDRLKEEFLKLSKKLLTNGSNGNLILQGTDQHYSKNDRKEDVSIERAEYEVKLELYKEQIRKMTDNIDLFKESIEGLKKRNGELEQQLKQSSQPANSLLNSESRAKSQLQHMNGMLGELRDDNERLQREIKSLNKEDKNSKELIEQQKQIIQQQNGMIKGLQSVIDKTVKRD